MGYVRHHAIIVTSWDDKFIKELHQKAVDLFDDQVTSVVGPAVNGYHSFMIGPDGSNEGWDRSYEGDTKRDEFVKFIKECTLDNKYADFVVVEYPGDGSEPLIIDWGGRYEGGHW